MCETRLSREDEDRRRRQSPFFNRTQSRSRTRSRKGSTDNYAGRKVDVGRTPLETGEILYSPYAKASTKDVAVQTEPKDFSWNSPSSVEKPDALKEVPARITNVKRRRLNKEYNWSRY